MGGDEFTILLEQMRDPSDAARMAERIADALREPFVLKGQQVLVSSSIGIALDTDRSHRPSDLLREADLAMYRAKSSGKACYEIFDTDMAERAMERLELETQLRRAAERGELVLRYRPVVSLVSEEIKGLDAQLYWQHPSRGLLEPREFQAVAEEAGISVDLGRWALEQACRDARQWQALRPGIPVQLDLWPRQVEQPDLVATVGAALASTGLPPACLRLEVPEAVVAQADNEVIRVLATLHEAGVRLALDDLGAGVSSLARLSRLPVEVMKFHSGIGSSAAFVRASVALGAALGMTVSVQGVEHAEQAARLAALGCASAEGDLYGSPMPVASVLALLASEPTSLRVVA
jgi:predicted signal transduction protein with EAL and GGDEF domain